MVINSLNKYFVNFSYRAGESIPSRQSIVRAYMRLLFRSHILVIFVNDVKAMQAFLYQFSV